MEHYHDRSNSSIRVLVADNSLFHTQLLAGALNRDPGLQALSSELSAASLMAASSSQRIDVFVLSAFAEADARRGFRVLQELRESNPRARAVMLLDASKPDSIQDAFRAGAKGVFDHQESSDMLCQCIRKVHQGQVWVNNEQMAVVLDGLASTPRVRAVTGNGMNLLSKREADVVSCVAEGLTNREIGERLGLSQHTIKNHMCRIFDKLGVSSRIELLFMTLSQATTATPLFKGIQGNPTDGPDEETLALCQQAAENGEVTAQLALARSAWNGRASDSDVIPAYMWYCVAIDQLTRTKNTVKTAMNPAQLAEAERRVSEWLNKSRRIQPSAATQAPLSHGRKMSA